MPFAKKETYTTDYIYALPEGQRAELEVASPGTKRIDYGIKLFKYRSAGVREYWIVNPLTKTVNVYDLEKEEMSDQYIFDDDIPVCIYDGEPVK